MSFSSNRVTSIDAIEGVKVLKNYAAALAHMENNNFQLVGYVDGTTRPTGVFGGTPTTFTTSYTTTNPLENATSLRLNKSNPAQGQGAYFNFTPTRAHRLSGSVLEISFNWELDSGIFTGSANPSVDSSVIVGIWDVANNRYIEPSNRNLEPATSNFVYKYKSTFQIPTNATTLRLFFHCTETNANAFILRVDDLYIGEQVSSYGPSISDPEFFTPGWFSTGTQPSIGNGIIQGWKTKTGAWYNYHILIQFGSTTTFGTGGYQFEIPEQIDTTKTPGNQDDNILGIGSALKSGIARYPVWVVKTNSAANRVSCFYANSIASGVGFASTLSQGAPATFASGDLFIIKFSAPIVNATSGVKVSNGFGGREISFRAARSTVQSIPNNTPTDILFNSVNRDTVNSYNPSTGIYTILKSGLYNISTQVGWSANSTNGREVRAFIDGGAVIINLGYVFAPTASSIAVLGNSTPYYLNAGQTVKINVFQNSGSALNVGGDASITWFGVEAVSQSESVSETPTVNAGYRDSSGQTVSVAATIKWNTKDTDPFNMFNPTTGQFLIPFDGVYEVSFQLFLVNSAAETGFTLRKNESGIVRTQPTPIKQGASGQATNQELHHLPPFQVPCNAGNRLDVLVSTLSAANLYNVASDNWISIKRIK